MKSADVVIGANWGDEGKGLATDFLASHYGHEALVVRYCGGAQAGHTVTTPQGLRHVFSHFGSGGFCGSPTYLSRFFVANPILFLAEANRLEKMALRPRVLIDPSAAVTTPYDMMINQISEERRGEHRHGSCGLGVGETVERQQHPSFALSVSDLYNLPLLERKLEHVRLTWAPARLSQLGITQLSPEWADRFTSDGIQKHFVDDVTDFLDRVRTATPSCMRSFKHVIFEGSQGLLLDQNHKWFPHVTRANTGLQNVVVLAEMVGIEKLTPYYVSRSYATRHGAGPFPHELAAKPYQRIVDLTNVPNDFQGSLRFGWLDLDILSKAISDDLIFARNIQKVDPRLLITCLDQIEDAPQFISSGERHVSSNDAFVARLGQCGSFGAIFGSYGPTRATVRALPLSPPIDHVSGWKKDSDTQSDNGSRPYRFEHRSSCSL